jgi:hypothetical protein
MADFENIHSPAEIRHRIGAAGVFSLTNVSGDIRLRGIDGDDVIVAARWEGGDDDRPLPLVVRRTQDGLHVESHEKDGSWFSLRGRSSVEFDVSVPKGARVDISVVSADVEAHGLQGDQSYKTISGDLVVDGCGGRVSATTVSGDVQLTGVQPLEVNINTTSGDVEAFADGFQPVRLRTVSGDLSLRGRFTAGPQHTVESVSGDLTIETMSGLTVDTKRGLDFSKANRGPIVIGDGAAHLRFRSLSGDIDVSGASAESPQTAARSPRSETNQPQADDEDSLEILRALERGEIDVEEASRRLEGAGSRG